MKKCKYCNKQYTPRPQVKNPIACNDPKCQKKRQSDNEKSWHQRNKEKFDSRYHQRKRKSRYKKMISVLKKITQIISVGSKFLGAPINLNHFESLMLKFLKPLGIRQINKFWNAENNIDFDPLGYAKKPKVLKTSS